MKSSVSRIVARCALTTGGLVLASSACAQSSVSLYGIVDAFAGPQRAPGGARSFHVDSGGMSTSYWGFGGTEDLGDGLKTIFAVEGFFRTDTGASGSFDGDPFFSRNAYVGISGRAGIFVLGRQSSQLYLQSAQFNPFYASFSFSPTINQLYAGLGTFPSFNTDQGVIGGTAWSNAFQYSTPTVGGFTARAMYAPGESSNDNRTKRFSAQAQYLQGPWAASYTYQYQNFRSVAGDLVKLIAGFQSQTVQQVGASYDMTVVRFFGEYTHAENTLSANSFHVASYQAGVTVPVGLARVLASFGESRDSGGLGLTRRTASVSCDYAFSKRTDVYAAYTNDKLSGISGGNTLGLGIRTRF